MCAGGIDSYLESMRVVRNRILLSSLVLTFVVALGLWPAAGTASAAAPVADAADLRTPAGATVAALVGSEPTQALAVLPANFEDEMGYRPLIADGAPINPQGDCSSPIPLPGRFESACKVHDFGYDLLRLAGKDGRPLGAWARIALDRMLIDRMHDSCTNLMCDWAADLARAGVAFNTWRQQSGVPVGKESLTTIAASTVVRGGEDIASAVGVR